MSRAQLARSVDDLSPEHSEGGNAAGGVCCGGKSITPNACCRDS